LALRLDGHGHRTDVHASPALGHGPTGTVARALIPETRIRTAGPGNRIPDRELGLRETGDSGDGNRNWIGNGSSRDRTRTRRRDSEPDPGPERRSEPRVRNRQRGTGPGLGSGSGLDRGPGTAIGVRARIRSVRLGIRSGLGPGRPGSPVRSVRSVFAPVSVQFRSRPGLLRVGPCQLSHVRSARHAAPRLGSRISASRVPGNPGPFRCGPGARIPARDPVSGFRGIWALPGNPGSRVSPGRFRGSWDPDYRGYRFRETARLFRVHRSYLGGRITG